jgi:hypothetical protein
MVAKTRKREYFRMGEHEDDEVQPWWKKVGQRNYNGGYGL